MAVIRVLKLGEPKIGSNVDTVKLWGKFSFKHSPATAHACTLRTASIPSENGPGEHFCGSSHDNLSCHHPIKIRPNKTGHIVEKGPIKIRQDQAKFGELCVVFCGQIHRAHAHTHTLKTGSFPSKKVPKRSIHEPCQRQYVLPAYNIPKTIRRHNSYSGMGPCHPSSLSINIEWVKVGPANIKGIKK